MKFARLIAADLVAVQGTHLVEETGITMVDIGLTNRGRMMVEAWLEGDEDKYKKALVPTNAPRNT